MKVTIASPDKISISTFVSFMRFCLGKEYSLVETYSLMSQEALKSYIEGYLKKSEKLIISFYAKNKASMDPLKIIPETLIDSSDLVVWMDLYSMEWVIIKDSSNQAPYYVDRWKMNMEKLNR